MDERSYSDFDLIIEQAGDRYRARVINSPAGQASVEFDSLFSPLELENFVLRMGRPQRGMRRIDSTEMQAIRNFGTRLFRTVFSEDVYACYLRSIDNTLNQNKGLRIRLRINVPEFHDLPWEFLYNPQFSQFLALSKDTPIIRYIELPYTTQALPVKTPMKILVMISSPEGYPPLDVMEEWNKLNRALKPLINKDLVILEKLENPTLSALQKKLRREQVHIFHYIGHGKYFEDKQDGMLLLEDEYQRGRPTSGQHLGAILHDHHHLRLVVLNACEGARTSAEDPYAGVAQTLVRQGIPAVLAMQFEIFEDAAMTLAQEFYSAIVDGYPVDAALSEARKAIFASNNDVEWGTPVLFMRTPNGVLFRPETSAEKETRLAAEQEAAEKAAREKAVREAEQERARIQRLSKLNRLYDQAKTQMAQQDWPAMIEFLIQIQGIEPGFRDVAALLAQAQAEQDRVDKIAELIIQGNGMIQNEDWANAANTLQSVLALAPDHEEAQLLLEKAETQIKHEQELQEQKAEEQRQAHLIKLYEHANTKMTDQDWIGASKLLKEIDQTEPGFRNVKKLMEQARNEKERLEKIVHLVAKGKEHLENHEWLTAMDAFQEALILDSGNVEVRALLAETERGKKVQELFDTAKKYMQSEQWVDAIAKLQELLELEPAHVEAMEKLSDVKIKLARQIEANQKKKATKSEESTSPLMGPSSFPEEIKPSKPSSLPEEIKPRRKPKDLPK